MIYVATRVNRFHECRNKCFVNSRGLSVNTFTYGKPHGIDMDTRRELVADSDGEMNNNNNDNAEIQYSTRPDLQVSAPTSERGQGHSGVSSKGDRPSPRIPNPHEIESGFVGQVGFLGSKSGQLERSLAPGSHSSPAARLAWHSQQQQQGSCGAVTASPPVEGSERSLFNVDLNPYISPVITNHIGMGRNAGNSPPDDPTQAQGACKKNSGWGPAAETRFLTE